MLFNVIAPKESNNKLHENDRAFLYPAGPGRDRVQEHEVFDHRAAAGRHHPQLHKYSKGMTTDSKSLLFLIPTTDTWRMNL